MSSVAEMTLEELRTFLNTFGHTFELVVSKNNRYDRFLVMVVQGPVRGRIKTKVKGEKAEIELCDKAELCIRPSLAGVPMEFKIPDHGPVMEITLVFNPDGGGKVHDAFQTYIRQENEDAKEQLVSFIKLLKTAAEALLGHWIKK